MSWSGADTPLATARSWLFVPASRPDRFAKAAACGADAVVLDLEDSVAPAQKGEARKAVARWFSEGNRAFVRINGVDMPEHRQDVLSLSAHVGGGLAGVVLPKAEAPASITALAREFGPQLPLVALIETAKGTLRALDIAGVESVGRLAFGSLDLGAELGVEDDEHALLHARAQLVLASRAEGIAGPIDGVTVRLDAPKVLAADIARGRSLGFTGKLCVHPQQAEPVNSGLGPSAQEVEWAQRVIAAAATADGVLRVDDEMVDRPRIERAEALVRQVRSSGRNVGGV